jgi:DNA-binding MarR family transcriptional regulator
METISPTPAHLKSHLGFWLRFVSNQVSGSFAAKLAGEGISVAEWAALRELHGGELAPSVLAGRLGMTRGAITKLAGRLIRRKLVRRRADAQDGRGQFLALSVAGEALVPKLAALADRNDAEYFAFLGKAERGELEKILKRIVRHHGLSQIPLS